MTNVAWRATPGRRGDASTCVEPLDERGSGQGITAAGSALRSDPLKENPGNRILFNEVGVGGGMYRLGPDGARIARVLPRGANGAVLERVGAEVVRGELPTILCK